MSRSDHFAIECADGTAVTLYVSAALPAEQWRSVRQAVDELPATVRVLRLQLMGAACRELPSGLGDLVRHWRELRQRPVHLNLAVVAPRSPDVGEVATAPEAPMKFSAQPEIV